MPRASASLDGMKFLVTGSTDGIGRHTALKLAEAGATVLLHGRNAQKVSSVAKEAQNISKDAGKVFSYTYDLASLEQIKQFAAEVRKDHEAIDVLINNAGVFETQKNLSEDGFEMTWAVNVLAPFALTALLIDKVTQRVVNTSSISAGSSIDFTNLNQEKGYSEHRAYSLSKLCSMLFTYQLAERVKSRGLTVNCLDPGTVNTKMLYAGWGPCGIDIEDANDEFYVATAPELREVTGAYFVGGRKSRSPSVAYQKDTQQHLWDVMEEHTGVKFPC